MLLRALKNKKWCLEYLGSRCVNCNSTDILEFDHIDPSTKKFCIATRYDFSRNRLKVELDKCQLLCNSCHWLKTREDRRTLEYYIKNKKTIHGTSSMYANNNCRCIPCKAAWNEYVKIRRHRNKQNKMISL